MKPTPADAALATLVLLVIVLAVIAFLGACAKLAGELRRQRQHRDVLPEPDTPEWRNLRGLDRYYRDKARRDSTARHHRAEVSPPRKGP